MEKSKFVQNTEELDKSTPDIAKKMVTLRRRGNLDGRESNDSIGTSLGNRKRVEVHSPFQHHRDRKKHEPSEEQDWGWFVDVPFSPGSPPKKIANSPANRPSAPQMIPSSGTPSETLKTVGQTDTSPRPEPNDSPTEPNENVIGKSNSLLRLWDSMSVDIDPASVESSKLSKAIEKNVSEGESLPHVTSFCFEMDI